jgi:hypothetical protein
MLKWLEHKLDHCFSVNIKEVYISSDICLWGMNSHFSQNMWGIMYETENWVLFLEWS